jgi:hypothetical protein
MHYYIKFKKELSIDDLCSLIDNLNNSLKSYSIEIMDFDLHIYKNFDSTYVKTENRDYLEGFIDKIESSVVKEIDNAQETKTLLETLITKLNIEVKEIKLG